MNNYVRKLHEIYAYRKDVQNYGICGVQVYGLDFWNEGLRKKTVLEPKDYEYIKNFCLSLRLKKYAYALNYIDVNLNLFRDTLLDQCADINIPVLHIGLKILFTNEGAYILTTYMYCIFIYIYIS